MSVDPTSESPAIADGDAAPAGETPPSPPRKKFAELGLHDDVLRALAEMGFAEAMPVQSETLAPTMSGRDVMIQSKTGSGKTAAFGIPFAEKLVDGQKAEVQALVLAPTRELALQVATEVEKISQYRGIKVAPVYGGAPMGKQIAALEAGAQVVAGTPGRVLDHLRRGTLKTKGVKILVLDEADEMLSMGFQEEIIAILERLPKERQTLLFSATLPPDIVRIARKYMRDPETITLSADYIGVETIQHAYYPVSGINRTEDLRRVLEIEQPSFAIIFCNTKDDTEVVAEFLRKQGRRAEAISSNLTQADRERVMGLMRNNELEFLCATDIAARGIDISDLSHVINYAFPESAEVYVHRTGRTGRAGKSGIAISLVGPRELGALYYLRLLYKVKPEERRLPSDEELKAHAEGERYHALAMQLHGEPGSEWRSLARRIASSVQGERLFAELLRDWFARAAGRPTPPAQAPSLDEQPTRTWEASSDEAPTRRREPRGRTRDDRGGRESRGPRDERGRRDRDERSAPADGEVTLPGKVTARAQVEGDPSRARLYLNLGRRDMIETADIAAILREHAGLAEGTAEIELRQNNSYLTVSAEDGPRVLDGLRGKFHGGREIVCEPAKARSY